LFGIQQAQVFVADFDQVGVLTSVATRSRHSSISGSG
jgi:hypothetical protein